MTTDAEKKMQKYDAATRSKPPNRSKKRARRQHDDDIQRILQSRHVLHETRLREEIMQMRERIDELLIVERIATQLSTRGVHIETRQRVIQHTSAVVQYLRSTWQAAIFRASAVHVDHVQVYGGSDSIVIQMTVAVRGVLTSTVAEKVYTAIPGNSQVLARLLHDSILIPCVFQLAFASDGSIEFDSYDIEAMRAMTALFPGLSTTSSMLAILENVLAPTLPR